MAKAQQIPQLNEILAGRKTHIFYAESVKLYNALRVHFDGEYPGELIEERRPHESPKVKDYRKKIWQPITREEVGKVYTELMKIRRADDYKVDYTKAIKHSKVEAGEDLQSYCELNFTGFTSVTNWAFNVLLKVYALDSNAVMLTMPLVFNPSDASEFRKPYPFLFHSPNVLDYREGEYAVLRSDEKIKYKIESAEYDGEIIYAVDRQTVVRYEQVSLDRKFKATDVYEHKMPFMPAMKLRGIVKKSSGQNIMHESRLSYMLPHLNEAVREYSDLQAEVVQHIFSEPWEYEGQPCKDCKGSGKVLRKGKDGVAPQQVVCPNCEGSGSKNPYDKIVVKKPLPGEQVVTPPKGYIEKDVEIVKIQDERVEKHKYKALASINMQFLHRVPLSESGESKKVDQDALNTFANAIAEDLVAAEDFFYKCCAFQRYIDRGIPEKEILAMLPYISVPERFDFLSSDYLMAEIKAARDGKLSSTIVSALEVMYTSKKFSSDPYMRDAMRVQNDLDPLAGMSDDDKLTRLQNKGITLDAYIISCNIVNLVHQAFVDMGDKFYALKFPEQKKKIDELAAPLMAELKKPAITVN